MPPSVRPAAADRENYHGRRRLPQLPGRRYASVVGVAFAAALVMAAIFGVALPDHSTTTQAQVKDQLYQADDDKRQYERPGQQTVIPQAGADYWTLPVNPNDCTFRVTSNFGLRYDPYYEYHPGFDLACPGGATYQKPIYAAHAGLVVWANTACQYTTGCTGYGNHVLVYCGTDADGNIVQAVYGHADSVVVKTGDQVKAGQLLAYVGYTGDVYPQGTAGSHLHFEIDLLAKVPPVGSDSEVGAVDPAIYLAPRGVDLNTFKAAAAGDDFPVQITDGQAQPSPTANPTDSASPSPSGSASPTASR